MLPTTINGGNYANSQGHFQGNDEYVFTQIQQWKTLVQNYDFQVTIGAATISIPNAHIKVFEHGFSFNHFMDDPIKVPMPARIELHALQQKKEDDNVGKKRNFYNDVEITGGKRALVGLNADGNQIVKEIATRPTNVLFSENILTVKEGYWADRSGRIKLIANIQHPPNHPPPSHPQHMQSQPPAPSVIIICAVYCTFHPHRLHLDNFIDPQKPKNQSNDMFYGLKDFNIHVTIRDIVTSEELYRKTCRENFQRVDSPFRQTVAFQLIDKAEFVNKEFIPFHREQYRDSLRLVADVSIFDCNQRVFWARSGFMWFDTIQQIPNNNTNTIQIYHAAMLSPPPEQGNLAIQFQISPDGRTVIRSLNVSISLSKVTSWFEKYKGIKIPAISKLLIDINASSSPPENPLDIFSHN